MENMMLTSWQLIRIKKEKNWVCIEQLEDDIGINRKNCLVFHNITFNLYSR